MQAAASAQPKEQKNINRTMRKQNKGKSGKGIGWLFRLDKNPRKGLLSVEWVAMGYLLLTTVLVLLLYTKMENPTALLMGRARVVAMTAALWLVYRLVPCPLTRFARIGAQILLLAWWYPDTYELNRTFQNLDHIFAQIEQSWFGCQPALLFCQKVTSPIVSELFDFGYGAYYPMIALVMLYYFFWRYHEFERAAFILLASFFLFYVIFVFVPVVGPTFYYKAVGLKKIAAAVFPPMHDYFNRGSQGSRRAPHGSLSQLARGSVYGADVAALARAQPWVAVHAAACLRAAVLCHGLHTGSLPHRCHLRLHRRNALLLCFPAAVEELQVRLYGAYGAYGVYGHYGHYGPY